MVICPISSLSHGDLHQRLQAATREIELHPKDAALYLRRADLHRQHQEWSLAAADCERAAQLDPTLAGVELIRGRILFDQGKIPEARAALDKYISRENDDPEALVTRARVFARLNEGKAAAADYSRAIALAPEPQPDYYLERAQALSLSGEPGLALRGLEEGIERLGPLLTLQQAALELEITSASYDAALTRLDTILLRVSRKEQWLAKRGDVLLKAGRPKDAEKAYREALQAVSLLPARLQQSPAVIDLVKRSNEALRSPPIQNRPSTRGSQ